MKEEKEELEINNSEQEDNNSVFKYIPYLLLLIILLFFCVFSTTYSIRKGDGGSDSEIETGQIVFTYSDVDKAGSGIILNDALPISDNIGKNLTGKNEYFDFSVTATTSKTKILYKVLAKKDSSSTLENKNVRIYLTQTMGGYEVECLLNNFSELKKENISGQDYYVLYEKVLDDGLSNYTDSYRLRMWVDEKAVDYNSQNFSLHVDVYARQAD